MLRSGVRDLLSIAEVVLNVVSLLAAGSTTIQPGKWPCERNSNEKA